MKRFSFGLSVVLLSMLLAGPAFCLPMVTIEEGTYRGNSGGEFVVTPMEVPGLVDGVPFNTWCIEKTEYINLNGTYLAEISDVAVLGGGGSVNGEDPLDNRTTWLYGMYLDGFAGFDSGLVVDSDAEAALFQNAIWYLEDEIPLPSNNKYLDLANLHGAAGDASVKVLNLYGGQDSNGNFIDPKQSQLVRIPDATTLSLLGSAMVIAALLGRRKRYNV